MIEKPISARARVLPLAVLLGALLIWSGLSLLRVFPESIFPSPLAVANGFVEEARSGRLTDDPTNKLVRVPLCVVYDLERDKIKWGRVYFEMPVLLQQLGVGMGSS